MAFPQERHHLTNGSAEEAMEDISDEHLDQQDAPINPFGDEGVMSEQYAIKLDELLPDKDAGPKEVWTKAMQLAKEYHEMARDTLRSLRQQQEIAMTMTSPEPARPVKDVDMDVEEMQGLDGRARESVNNISELNERTNAWQLEAETWDIFQAMASELYHTPTTTLEREQDTKTHLPGASPLTSEIDLQREFFKGNSKARTRAIVLEWLKRSAASEREPIDRIVTADSVGADGYTEIHANGWLETREEIKKQKRSTGLVGAAVPQTSDRLAMNARGMVTQLDPDASTRQHRSLQKADLDYEAKIWKGCYEMLRRGMSWETIRQWCQEKKEGWRAISLGGSATEWDLSLSKLDKEEPFSRPVSSSQLGSKDAGAHLKSRLLWRRTCLAAARRAGGNIFERAAYGILSGDLASVKGVSNTWDDALFAHLNTSLHQDFAKFITLSYPSLLPASSTIQALKLEEDAQMISGSEDLDMLTERLKASVSLKDEDTHVLKDLQAAIIANKISSRLAHLSDLISIDENYTSKDTSVSKQSSRKDSRNEQIIRILTHLALVNSMLSSKDVGKCAGNEALQKLMPAYVKLLRSEGKLDMIPLYAGLLSKEQQNLLLGPVIFRIGDRLSKENFLKLMEQNGMNVRAIIIEELRRTTAGLEYPTFDNPRSSPFVRSLVEPINDEKRVPLGLRHVEINGEIEDSDLILIQSLEWLLSIDGVLAETFERGADLYGYFYAHTKLAAAQELLARVRSTTIIQLKGDQVCQDPSELKDIVDELLPGNDYELPNSPILPEFSSNTQPSPSLRRSAILLVSRRYRQFEQLTRSLAALQTLRLASDDKPSNSKDVTWKKALKSAFDTCCLETTPLLRDWLKAPKEEMALSQQQASSVIRSEQSSASQQAALDKYLRAVYLPELVLALHNVYNFAGHFLSRDHLVACLDLANTVAAPDSGLADCFLASGRMSELLAGFAWSSRQMMLADQNQGSKPRDQLKGAKRRLGMWRVRLEEREGKVDRRDEFVERVRAEHPGARFSILANGAEVDLKTWEPILAE